VRHRCPARSLLGASLFLLAACGSNSTAPDGGRPAISISVVPSTASLLTGGSQDFTATVTNDPSKSGVTWGITGCSGGPGVCGSLSKVTTTTATYTAPATVPPGTLGVTATAVRDNSKSVTASVAITAIVADGQIAFTSIRDGNREVYLMHADGTGQVNLTNNAADDEWPVWSPDGSRILFGSTRDGGSVYEMNADGSGVTRLLSTEENALAWSPDGTKIAFDFHDGHYGIYVMNADGSGVTRLATNAADDRVPAWSPDGGKIAFMSFRDGNWEIYLMHADGTALVNLTNNPAQDEWPAWSPDGSKILFLSASDGRWEIYVMNADGSGVTQLTTIGTAFDPAWSPDGTKIAFDDDNEIYVINADGSGLRNITNDPAHFDGTPVWSPDGSKIVFESNRDGNAEVYVMNADGSALRNLTNNPAIDFAPAWRPRGP